ncbi:MAG: hypothetical protein ACLPX7_00270 [Xanthobacteraceae bacterium]
MTKINASTFSLGRHKCIAQSELFGRAEKSQSLALSARRSGTDVGHDYPVLAVA